SSIFANARTLDEYWNNIIDKVDGITDVPADRWLIDDYFDEDPTVADKTYCKRGGFIPEIDFDPMEFGLPPNILEVTDVAQMLTLIVAREVLKDAGVLDNPSVDRDRIGVTLGIGGGQKLIGPLVSRLQYPILDRVLKSSGVEQSDRDIIIDKFKKAYIGWEENSFPGMLGNVISGRVANRFDLGGMNCVVDAACAASLAAMKMAIRELQTGASDMMLTGGICCDNSIFMYMSFSKTPAFTPTGIIQPFDHKSQGMLVGEGLGMVALKRLEDAERDGDQIYAVVKGVGSSSDGKYKSIYAPRSSGQAKALQRAYDEAGFAPSTVGLIEAHGTGTVAGDAAEFGGLRAVFENGNERKNHIALGSVKSQIGHTKSAAGVAGFIKIVSALHHKVLPPTINVTEPNPALDIADSAFYLNTESRPWIQDGDTPRRAGVSAFGFGGTNFHFAVEEYKPKVDGKYRRQHVARSLVLSATDRQTLQQLCQTELGQLREQGSLHFESFVKTYAIRNIPNEHARFGFVANDVAEAIEGLEKAVAKLEMDEQAWQTPSGLFYRSTAVDAKSVAGLFSGQGSQYVNMGKDIAMNFPPLLNVMSAMNALFKVDDSTGDFAQILYPNPVFNKDDEKALAQQLQLTQYAQPAIGSMSLGLYKIFRRAGLDVNCVAGHSFGELTAYCAAGVISEPDYLMLAKIRGQSMAAPKEEGFDAGTMIAVVGDSTRVEGVIQDIEGVQIANFNSGNQVVVAGKTPAIAIAKDALKAADLRVVDLPVSAAFHTPLVSHAYKPFANAIDTVAFNVPQIPVYSNTTGVVHPSDVDTLKNQLKDHVLNSVQFKSEIEAMYEAGARVFVEFGPKNVLTKLTQEILKQKPHHCVALNANPKKNSDVEMRSAAVQLAVLGVLCYDIDTYEVTREKLSEKTVPKMSVKLTGANYVSPKTAKIYQDALNNGHQIKQAAGAPVAAVAPTNTVEPVSDVSAPTLAPEAAPIAAAAAVAVASKKVSAAPSAPSSSVSSVVASAISTLTPQMLSVVADKTGYPEDMLELSMDMEADLGIDSIKRVEILGAMQDHVGDLPDLDPDELSELRTLQEVVDYLEGKLNGGAVAQVVASSAPVPALAVSAAPVAATVAFSATSASVSDLTPQMLSVVADKTGYPEDMLELSMDMEADLGIDSIKRVEILGAMQDHVGDLPDLDPDELSELRTLQEVVDYLEGKLPGGVAVVAPQAVASSAPAPAPAPAAPARILAPNAPEPISEQAPSSAVEVISLTQPTLRQIDNVQSHVLLVDEGTEFTQRCVEKLCQQQLKVILLKWPEDLVSSNNQFDGVQVAPLVSCDEQDIKTCLDNVGMVSSIQALVFLQPVLMNMSQDDRMRYVTASFMLLKHIHSTLMNTVHQSKQAALLTVSRLDGSLGYGATVLPDVSQSALLGLTKTAKHEWNNIYCRAVDIAPSINATTAADHVFAELFDQQQIISEVGYSSMGRVMLERASRDSYQLPMGRTVNADSVFLVSGGAKGVTKSCVLRLAKQHMCCFILLGRSDVIEEPDWAKNITDDASLKRAAMDDLILRGEKPTPVVVNRVVNDVLSSREINETLSDIKACGARATYVSVDVTDKDALNKNIAPSVQAFGQVTGIIHGAGVLADKLIVQKKPDEIERVYKTKVLGLLSMLACVDRNALTHLALFSSAAGFYGNVGQSDYSAANETLNKFALNFKRSRPSCHVLSFNWGPWDGGMVTDSLRKMFSERGVYVIPVDSGAQLFVNELVAESNECVQILVGTGIVHGDTGAPSVKKSS
ncbi:MAG: SDR family NAD(P)-dependent oxidoreductase, partial [Pseudomonadota bacterium]